MSLPEFADEKEFRECWIAPFLSKMGFILPKHVHGADEQGKDFYFADHDRFGHLRFYSAQAKIGNVGTGNELTTLLDQIERSFKVSLKYHKGAHEQRIASIYVMVTGTISAAARERIWERCKQRNYGENVFFMDGETLSNLDRHAAYQSDLSLRPVVAALLRESVFNIEPTQTAECTCRAGNPSFKRCRVLVLEQALKDPLPDELVPYRLLSAAWEFFDQHNKRVVPYNLSYEPAQLPILTRNAQLTVEANLRIRDACDAAIKKLDDKFALSLEVRQSVTPGW